MNGTSQTSAIPAPISARERRASDAARSRSGRPRARLVAIAYTVLLTYLLLTPSPLAIFGRAGQTAQRAIDWSLAGGLQHVAAFMVFAGLWTWAAPTRRGRLAVVGWTALYAVATELVQGVVPNRECDWQDVLANLAGIALGVGLVWLVSRPSVAGSPDR